ncbi:MAG: hypothetical protein FWH29_00365 [Methanobrevibacter sp.]|nr:hypothetical protein [Methanobrevibacter sp.]
MLNEVFYKNKRKILIFVSIFLMVAVVIGTVETVNAYSVSYYVSGNKLTVNFNPDSTAISGQENSYNSSIKLGDGKTINLKVNDYYTSSRVTGTYSFGYFFPTRDSSASVTINTSANTPKMKSVEYNWKKDGLTSWSSTMGSSRWSSDGKDDLSSDESHNYYIRTTAPSRGSWIKINRLTITFDKNIETSSSSSSNKADLKIAKVSKKGNTHTVFIKNSGKKAAAKSVLGVYDGKTLIKKVNVKAIAKGKTVQVKVPLAAKYKNKIKTFKADYNNKIKESNEKNNDKKAK